MAQSCCPVRDCTNPVPENGFICVECHFEIPRAHYGMIVRMRMDAQRASDPEKQKYFRQRFKEYLMSAGNKIAAARAARNEVGNV